MDRLPGMAPCSIPRVRKEAQTNSMSRMLDARKPSRLLLARRVAAHGDQALLGDEHAIAQDLVLAEIEQPVEQAHERRTERSSPPRSAARTSPVRSGAPPHGSRTGSEAWTRSSGRAPSSRGRRPPRCRPISCTRSRAGRNARSPSSGSPGACCESFLDCGSADSRRFARSSPRFLFLSEVTPTLPVAAAVAVAWALGPVGRNRGLVHGSEVAGCVRRAVEIELN